MLKSSIAVISVSSLFLPGLATAQQPTVVTTEKSSAAVPPKVESESENKTRINLVVGQVKLIPATDITRVAVGNGKLVTTSVLPGQILMLAEAAGDSNMHVWFKNGTESSYQIHVSPSDTQANREQLQAVLKGISGTNIDRVGDYNIITGELSRENMARVAAVAKLFPETLNMTQEEDVAMKKMVYMKVQIMEYKSNALKNIGLNWDQQINGPQAGVYGDIAKNKTFKLPADDRFNTYSEDLGKVPVSGLRGYLGLASIITSKINLAVNSGDAFVLAEPELSTRSGGEAKFLAGGEIPLVSSSANGTTVTYKEYGIRLNIKPVADVRGNVVAQIKAEVSSVDPSVTAGGFPGFLTRSSESVINVSSGQTLAISGLVDSQMSKDIGRLAGLSDLPILGGLFKSTNFRNNKSELVIFVTPMVVDPASSHNDALINSGKTLRPRFDKAVSE